MRAPWSSLLGLLCLLGCGKSGEEAPGAKAKRVALDDPPCDPKTPKVCVGQDVVACEPTGKLGRALRACHDGCERGKCKGTCSDEAVKLIYLVDSANDFMSFDPRLLPGDPFRIIGKLTCEGRNGSPFSMSVDRNGVAWVVYEDGELFKVDIADAHCEPSGYVAGSSGATNFGMGFATDAPGSDAEKLYIAADDGSNALHAIDTKDLIPRRRGTIQAANSPNPELTGGSDAKLYGFYPQSAGVAFVQQIDRMSGNEIGPRWPLGTTPLGDVNAYAFAQWAGVFYIFVTTFDGDTFEQSSTVRTLDPTTGKFETIMQRLPFRITGAGVSTCAPERDAKQP